MTKFSPKLSAAVAMAVVFASTLVPVAFADTMVDVSGNGANSTNNVTVSNTDKMSVKQTNNSTIVTDVNASSNSGGNNANYNTGGDTSIMTGDASTKVKVSVGGSTNSAVLRDCTCKTPDNTVNVMDNGADSTNTVDVTNKNKLTVKQKNYSYIVTGVNAKSKTGKNDANSNTGGSTGISTGNATTNVKVKVTGSSNTL